MLATSTADVAVERDLSLERRRRIADRVFRAAVVFNIALTLFWLAAILTQGNVVFFRHYNVDGRTLRNVGMVVLFLYVLWGFVVGFSKEERRQAFSSRMEIPFEVSAFVTRYSERRIRIVDMIGRRGRFITLVAAGFFYLYGRVSSEPSAEFATLFLSDNLFDAVVMGWILLPFYYSNGLLAAAFYGPQSRVMDGVQARANCLLITTLWSAFKFVMLPLGAQLAAVYEPREFAVVFALIWGSYIACDTSAEIGGSLFGRQKIAVRGIGDVNRKSIAGTLSGFAGSLVLCLWVVLANDLPAAWVGLAIVISASNTLLELYSPRGTDDFFMATGNALVCWAFGVFVR